MTENKVQIIPDMLCYCFGWTKTAIAQEIAQTESTKALYEIRFKMKTKGCSCATLNPSGKCCLTEVKQFINEKRKQANEIFLVYHCSGRADINIGDGRTS